MFYLSFSPSLSPTLSPLTRNKTLMHFFAIYFFFDCALLHDIESSINFSQNTHPLKSLYHNTQVMEAPTSNI